MSNERRFSPRVSMPYPARLWGADADGRAWKEDALIQNVSGGGLYLRLHHDVQRDAPLSVVVRLSTTPPKMFPLLRLGARGIVLRTEPKDDGTCGVALEFGRRRVF